MQPDNETLREARRTALMRATADIAVAAISNRVVEIGGVDAFLVATHATLAALSAETPAAQPSKPVPAVDPKKSVKDDHIVCLDDGKKFKSLKRHIATLGMTPDEYRAKWGLPADYPMAAPAYSAARSDLAKQMGLGRKPGQRANGASAH